MKKLMLVLVLVILAFSMCSCTRIIPMASGPRAAQIPSELHAYKMQKGEVTVKVTLPISSTGQSSLVIKRGEEILFDGILSERMTQAEYQKLLEITGWDRNPKLVNLGWPIGGMRLVELFSEMLEEDYELKGWYSTTLFVEKWTEVPVPKIPKTLLDD